MSEHLKLTEIAEMDDRDLFDSKNKHERFLKLIDYEIELRFFKKVVRQKEIANESLRNMSSGTMLLNKVSAKKTTGAKRGRKPGNKQALVNKKLTESTMQEKAGE